MKVFKFGGGILKNTEAIQAMSHVVRKEVELKSTQSGQQTLVVVVSAFYQMTNAFELVYNDIRQGKTEDLNHIVSFHSSLIEDLIDEQDVQVREKFHAIICELQNALKLVQNLSYDEGYDQVVSFGEILSSLIVSAYWEQEGLIHHNLDARKLIVTDSCFREGKVNWDQTGKKIQKSIGSDGEFSGSLFLTQGFIGGTQHGYTTTLGREGSDYTAAIIGSIIDAQEVVVWKDVPGILNADPTQFSSTRKLDEISYLEAVELSYFGAKVIHPNTIKPLQNKNIPLLVKSLFAPNDSGTCIVERSVAPIDIPVLIRKENQVLVSIQARDFSFVVEDALAEIFSILARYRIRINLMQHGAVSLSLVFNQNQKKLDALLDALLPNFKVLYNGGLELLTIRHYDSQAIAKYTQGYRIYVQQQSRKTARFVLG